MKTTVLILLGCFLCLFSKQTSAQYKYSKGGHEIGIDIQQTHYYRPSYKGRCTIVDGFGDHYDFKANLSEIDETRNKVKLFAETSLVITQITQDESVEFTPIGGAFVYMPSEFCGFDCYMGFAFDHKRFSLFIGPQYSRYYYKVFLDRVKEAWPGDPGLYNRGHFYDVGSPVYLETVASKFGLLGNLGIKLTPKIKILVIFDTTKIVFNKPEVSIYGDEYRLMLDDLVDNIDERIKLTNKFGVGISINVTTHKIGEKLYPGSNNAKYFTVGVIPLIRE